MVFRFLLAQGASSVPHISFMDWLPSNVSGASLRVSISPGVS